MNRKQKNINFLEQKLVYLLLVLFKIGRYIYRIFYKLVRLCFRLLKKMIFNFLVFLEPHIINLQEKIYLRACKVFDVKVENVKK